MNTVLETIYSRRSTRNFIDKPINEDELKAILLAGQLAPSGSNVQYNHFIVIQNKEIISSLNTLVGNEFAKMEATDSMYKSIKSSILRSKEGNYNFTYNANTLIIVANKKGHGNAMADSVCAIENMMIAASSLTIGSCYINQLRWLNENINIIDFFHSLGLKEDEIICASLIIGYSDHIQNTPLERHGNEITRI